MTDDRKKTPSGSVKVPLESNPARKNKRVGSRSPSGTARSTQRFSADQIFGNRILQEESAEAERLYGNFCADYKIPGTLASEVMGDLTINRLRKYRLDRAMSLAVRKAYLRSAIDEIEHHDQGHFHSPIRSEETAKERDEGPHPTFRVMLLERLKGKIDECGLDYEKDLAFLSVIFGDRRTALRAAIVAGYHAMAGKKSEKGGKEARVCIEAIENAIVGEKIRIDLERASNEFEDQPTILPRESDVGYLTKCIEANDREFARLLEHLESIRRLSEPSRNVR